jgi:hypothetical protein
LCSKLQTRGILGELLSQRQARRDLGLGKRTLAARHGVHRRGGRSLRTKLNVLSQAEDPEVLTIITLIQYSKRV